MKKFTLFFLFIFLLSCGRWKTNKLKSELLCTVNSGSSTGSVMLKFDDDDILDISFKIEVIKNNIYIADNILKRVQVLDKNCEPLLLIGDKYPDVPEKSAVKFSKFQFNIIEAIAVDSRGNIYIQNSFAPLKKNQQVTGKETGISLSYILVFDNKGSLLYTLGRTGSPDIPFTSIESLTIDQNDRLFVITRSYDMWTVYRFVNKRRDLNINFMETDLKEQDGKDTIIGKIEKIITYRSGDELLISAGYYNTVNFKYRKIYTYSINKDKGLETAFEITDHKNELFNMEDDKHLYLWDIDGKFIRYRVCNFKGDIVNNVSIKFPDTNSSFDEILADNSGNFYSYHASKKGVEVLEWR